MIFAYIEIDAGDELRSIYFIPRGD